MGKEVVKIEGDDQIVNGIYTIINSSSSRRAMLASNLIAAKKAEELVPVTRVHGKGGIKEIKIQNPEEVITPEALLKFARAAAIGHEFLYQGLTALSGTMSIGSELGSSKSDGVLQIEDALRGNSFSTLFGEFGAFFNQLQDSRKLNKLKDSAKPAAPGIEIAVQAAAAMPQLISNIDKIRREHESLLPQGAKYIEHMRILLTKLQAVQNTVKNKIPGIENQLQNYAQQVANFSENSQDPRQLHAMQTLIQQLTGLDNDVRAVSKDVGAQIELPTLITALFNTLMIHEGKLPESRRYLATARNAAIACHLLQMYGFTVASGIISSTLQIADTIINRQVGNLTIQASQIIIEQTREQLNSLPQTLNSISKNNQALIEA